MSTRQLTRSKSNRVIAGVAGGIANFTGLDNGLVRLVTAAVVLFTGGIGLVLYILAWIVLPEEGGSSTGLDSIIGAFRSQNNGNSNPNPNDYR